MNDDRSVIGLWYNIYTRKFRRVGRHDDLPREDLVYQEGDEATEMHVAMLDLRKLRKNLNFWAFNNQDNNHFLYRFNGGK